MTDLFLAIDIGNTHTVIGMYEEDTLLAECRLKSTLLLTKTNILKKFHSLLTDTGMSNKKFDGIGISSVVPSLTKVYSEIAKNNFHLKPMMVGSELNLGIKILYDDPATLGADRICNAIAGYSKYGGPLIIIDFGTATTYDVVASNGNYLGGVIAPGIETAGFSLHSRTAKLPRLAGTTLRLPETVIGKNTISSMQVGILLGAVDAMTGMVNRIQKELFSHRRRKAVVIATGGFSSFVAEHSRIIQHVEPTLVLDGIRLIYKRVKSNR
jgi:type III pantothenate kinase